LLVPIQTIVAGKLQLEKRIVDAEHDITHDHHQTEVQGHKVLNQEDTTEWVEKSESRDEDTQLSYDNCSCE